MRAADLLVSTLKNCGVTTIYTLSGNQIMPIFDACIDQGIRLIHTRHEAAAVYMAEAHGVLTGEIGVALVTAAPGFANALGAMYVTAQSENPVLVLTGDSPVSQDGLGAFQELDQARISAGLVRHAERVTQASEIGLRTANAIRVARTEPSGPVHLALPADILLETVSDTHAATGNGEPTGTGIDPAIVQATIDALSQAERPLIVTGPSLRATRTGSLMAELRQALGVPVICMESPRGLNDPAGGAFKSVMAQADLVVSLGKRPDFSTGFARGLTRMILIHPDARLLTDASHRLADQMLFTAAASPVGVMRALIDADTAPPAPRADWLQQVEQALAQRAPVPTIDDSQAMHPAHVGQAVQQLLDQSADPVLVIDGGEFGQWAQASVSANCRIINGPSGAIGAGLCYGIAAGLVRPGSTVVAMMGDGTAGFHFAEFDTAARYGVNLIAVIGHDARWNAEYQIQLREFGPDRLIECELADTRYDQAAIGLGCHGAYAQTSAELTEALNSAAATPGPSCVVARIQPIPAPTIA